jgi:hypothetical protein
MDDIKIPNAGEAYLRSSAFSSPARKRREEAYEQDFKSCLAKCTSNIQTAIPEGRYDTFVCYDFKGPAWADFEKDISKHLMGLGYKVTAGKAYRSVHFRIRWGLSLWDRLLRREPPMLALPLLPPKEFM